MGAFVAVALVTAGAYRLSKGGYAKAVVTDNLSHDLERTAFHESGFCLSIIGLYAGFTIAVTIVLVATHTSLSGRTPPVWSYVSMLCNPMMLLFLAYPIAILQFGWIRWRRRSEAVAWQLVGLSRGAFFANWIALMLLLIVVVPTLNAFAFILWLGPFDLLPLVGL